MIAVGTGKIDENGKTVPFNVKKGDLVLLPIWRNRSEGDGKEYQIVREDDILAVIG